MRAIFYFLFLVVIPGVCFAQKETPAPNLPVDPDSKVIQYRDVVNQDGNKDVLYDRGAEWFRSYYVNPGSVTKVQDKVNGKIEGTGRLSIYHVDDDNVKVNAGMVFYDIRLEFKENKYRYTLTNFALKSTSRVPLEKWLNKNDPSYNPMVETYLYQVDTTMQNLIAKLKEGMKPKVKKKDEW
jgi:prolyl oligopeptidase PreP (S9A serine peptidase family)